MFKKICAFSRHKPRVYRFVLLLALLLISVPPAQAEIDAKVVQTIRTLLPHEWGVAHPAGLTYSAQRNRLFLLEKNPGEQPTGQSTVVVLTPYEGLEQATRFNFNIGDALNIAFDDNGDRLFLLGGAPLQLVQVKYSANGTLDPTTETRLDASQWGLSNPEGMTVDHRGKFLFILDGADSKVVRIALKDPLSTARFETFDLAAKGLTGLHGIAINIENHHLFVLSPTKKMLYELTEDFKYLAQYDLRPLQLVDPSAFVFAYSADLTDSDKQVHLFIADSNLPTTQSAEGTDKGDALPVHVFLPVIVQSEVVQSNGNVVAAQIDDPSAAMRPLFGRIVEVNLDLSNAGPGAVTSASTDVVVLQLVQTIHTSAFNPPSPDPSGITYVPSSGLVLESDGEVEEMTIFAGKNLFGVTPPNTLSFTSVSTKFSNEPAGLAHNPTNGHYFYADDDQKRVREITVGSDGILGTTDDTATTFLTSAFSSNDPEGIDYDTTSGHLWIIDGLNREVYRVNPGPNGVFNGIPSTGDDIVTSFDTQSLGINDPEGITVHPNGNLIVTSNSTTTIYEVSKAGALLQTYDISAASALKIAGVTMAPGSNNPAQWNFWLVDRGVDNDENPNENDGKIYEFALPGTPPTATPTATATATLTGTATSTPLPPTATATATATPVSSCTPITVTYQANADSWIDQASAGNNFGIDSIIKVQGKSSNNFRTLLRFALPASMPAGCVVQSARLRLYAASWKTGRTLQAIRIAANWTENGVTWANQPLTTGVIVTTTSGSGYRQWDVTTQVQAIYTAGVNDGFLIRDAIESGSGNEQQFHSREKGSNLPQLIVTFTQ